MWLLWPEPDRGGFDRGRQSRNPDQHTVVSAGAAGGLAAAPTSVAVSAKRQLSGEAVGIHDQIEPRLPQVSETMPEIGIPDPSAVGRTATLAMAPAAEAGQGDGGAEAEMSAGAEAASGASAVPSVTAAPLDLEPDRALIARAEAAIEPAAPPLAAPGSAADRDGTAMARRDAPAVAMPPEMAGQHTPTWLRNAVAPAADHRPAIALVIDDLGWNRRASAALNRLRGPLTLAFLPYATKLDEQTRAARAAGHELLVHVPMEPRGQQWPGPNALTSQLEPVELIARLRSHLRSFRGFVGINNHMGSLLTTDPERMPLLMAELRRRDLLFLDSRTTPESIAAREAGRIGVPHAERDVFIDNDLDLVSVLRELAHVEHIARHRGHAVAIGHPHDVTIEALRTWLPTLDARDIALVPISTIVARRSCASGILLVAEACARYAVAATAVH